jgi:hypothetical protein
MITTMPWGGLTHDVADPAVGVADGLAWAAGSADATVPCPAVTSPTIIALILHASTRGARKLRSSRFINGWKIIVQPPDVA